MTQPYQDPNWQAELDRIAIPGGKTSWLHLYWEEGYDWEPVGRWMIGQVIPAQSISPLMRELLEGPNPADHGHFESDDYGHPRWVTDLPGVSRRQWHFFKDTGNYLRPYWVVQGSRGGHRYEFSFTERRIIEMNGGDPNPPTPGELPYAEPDARTFAQIGQRDLMRWHAYAINFMENSGKRIEEDTRRGLEEMRGQLWNMMGNQVSGYADEMAFHLRGHLDDAPPSETQYDKELETLHQSFIEQGA